MKRNANKEVISSGDNFRIVWSEELSNCEHMILELIIQRTVYFVINIKFVIPNHSEILVTNQYNL